MVHTARMVFEIEPTIYIPATRPILFIAVLSRLSAPRYQACSAVAPKDERMAESAEPCVAWVSVRNWDSHVNRCLPASMNSLEIAFGFLAVLLVTRAF